MIEKMPDDFKGCTKKNGGFTTSSPRFWTEREIEWVKNMRDEGYSAREIAESVGRTKTSVAIKLKRMSKSGDSYNVGHRDEKYTLNDRFVETVNPKSVLDCYCGERRFYDGTCPRVVSNDINMEIDADYHMDALKLMCAMYERGESFDLIDIDPYGSGYDCFDLAVKMAKKGIAITFGELGHKRWKRLDFVKRYYGIEKLDDFTLDSLIEHVQMIGRRNKKNLVVWDKREWRNIGRVWFTVEPMKITEQWFDGDGEFKVRSVPDSFWKEVEDEGVPA